MTKVKKLLISLTAVLGLTAGLTLMMGLPSSADVGDVVYQSCDSSRAHEITTDDNDVQVICEEWPIATTHKWVPILTPNTMPVVQNWSTCYVPGLQAIKSGGGSTVLTCSRHFSGYAYFEH